MLILLYYIQILLLLNHIATNVMFVLRLYWDVLICSIIFILWQSHQTAASGATCWHSLEFWAFNVTKKRAFQVFMRKGQSRLWAIDALYLLYQNKIHTDISFPSQPKHPSLPPTLKKDVAVSLAPVSIKWSSALEIYGFWFLISLALCASSYIFLKLNLYSIRIHPGGAESWALGAGIISVEILGTYSQAK